MHAKSPFQLVLKVQTSNYMLVFKFCMYKMLFSEYYRNGKYGIL